MNKNWKITKGDKPLIATAIHSGHKVRSEVENIFAISPKSRFREEDPFTEILTDISDNSIIISTSRFEFDLNRNREKAVYLQPKDAWNLKIYKKTPPAIIKEKSLKLYDAFYQNLQEYLDEQKIKFGKFVVFDIHSYNHQRKGENTAFDDPQKNPEIIIGTSNMKTSTWKKRIINRILNDFQHADFFGQKLDTKLNVKFTGGNFARWIHQNYPNSACVLSIEFKKIFMNEWSGKLDKNIFVKLHQILQTVANGTLQELEK